MSVTPELLQNTWQQQIAEINNAQNGGIIERALIHGHITLSAILRSSDRLPGIWIRVNSSLGTPRWQSQRFDGVHFERALRDTKAHLLPIMLAKEDAISVFSTFAADLASSIDTDKSPNSQLASVLTKINLWQRFFKKGDAGLSEEKIRGLFGELELFELIMQKRGFNTAFDNWKGPDGGLHDFELEDLRIEVKTWSNPESGKITISDPAQILIDENWPVYLFALHLSKNANGSTLEQKVNHVISKIPENDKPRMLAKLAEAGYLERLAKNYSGEYEVMEKVFYEIKEHFPHIDINKIPGGVINLKYSLEIGALDAFATDTPF